MTSLFEDHLTLDAVVAFADGEMGLTAFQRAAAHLAHCQTCAAEVAVQTTARQRLRSAQCPSIPMGLLDALRSIPVALPAPPHDDGPGVGPSPDGRSAAEDAAGDDENHGILGLWPRSLRGRGFRLGA